MTALSESICLTLWNVYFSQFKNCTSFTIALDRWSPAAYLLWPPYLNSFSELKMQEGFKSQRFQSFIWYLELSYDHVQVKKWALILCIWWLHKWDPISRMIFTLANVERLMLRDILRLSNASHCWYFESIWWLKSARVVWVWLSDVRYYAPIWSLQTSIASQSELVFSLNCVAAHFYCSRIIPRNTLDYFRQFYMYPPYGARECRESAHLRALDTSYNLWILCEYPPVSTSYVY